MAILLNDIILNAALLIAVYSLIGWVLEFVYKLILNKKIINPGMFYGPYLPIYGLSAFGIILISKFFDNSCIPTILAGTVMVTAFEYIIGTISEKYIGVKFWDYSDQKFNFKGRICLKYSLFWAILIGIFILFIYPLTSVRIAEIPYLYKLPISIFLFGIFFYDSILTIFVMLDIKKTVEVFNRNHNFFSLDFIKNQYIKLYRIMNSFSYFKKEYWRGFSKTQTIISANKGIREDIAEIINGVNLKNDKEYYEIIKDILENIEFRKTMQYRHHYGSIFDHSLYVSYYSYRITKKLKLDYISTARGALLHDFFLYDWRLDNPEKGENHGKEHPKTALRNASKQFVLNEIEQDIIINHMWPFTKTIPKSKEAFVVLIVDKSLASKELFIETKNILGNHVSNLLKKIPPKKKYDK